MNRTTYELVLGSQVPGAPPEYRFHTADGVHSKRSFRDPELLLLDHLWGRDLGDLLCPEANYGVVGVVLSSTARSVRMTESSARAARLCQRNVYENDAEVAVSNLADIAELDRRFDAAAYAPKPYTAIPVGKRRIADALSVLRPGGTLFLAGTKRAGLGRYENCLRNLSGSVRTVGGDGECRLVAANRPESVDPPAFCAPRELHPTVDGVDLSLCTVTGLFSPTSLDDGTRLLLEAATVEDGDRVLDLCCGYGPVGAYAGRVADCDLWLSDDDRVATRCAECSLRASDVEGTVVTADCVEGVADRTFDRILCNPPTHAGDGVLAELFAGASDLLASDGRLTLVHHRELDLGEHLGCFEDLERHTTGEEHVVLSATP